MNIMFRRQALEIQVSSGRMLRQRIVRIVCLLCLLAMGMVQAAGDNAAYRLAGGDEIAVLVLRHPELSQNYPIPPDGVITFVRAGQVPVAGLTTAEVAQALETRYAELLVAPSVTVTLLRGRVRNVFVLGEVARPGAYPLMGQMRISELIAAAGDLIGDLSELSATLNRQGQIIPIDLVQALHGKDSGANLQLTEGDTLWVTAPPRITVTVLGQVKNPGALKIREGSRPVDVLAQAGDVLDRPERMVITLLRGAAKQPLAWGDTTTVLRDGDVIQVEKEQQVRVYINGQVKTPAAYDLPAGGGVLEAIALAGGTLSNAALGQITIVRAETGQSERVDISQALTRGVVTSNPKLAMGDQVIVPEWTASISVWGKVNHAGKYPISETLPVTVVDAISLAGGYDKRARLSRVVVIRMENQQPRRIGVDVNAILSKGKSELNITLQNGDIVFVPESDADANDVLDTLSKIGILAMAF